LNKRHLNFLLNLHPHSLYFYGQEEHCVWLLTAWHQLIQVIYIWLLCFSLSIVLQELWVFIKI